MEKPSQIAISLSQPAVVGTVHSEASLTAAQHIGKGKCDWLELRVDNFFPKTIALRKAAEKLKLPRIVTVRHASEGGAATGITAQDRRALYGEFLEVAGMVDIELRREKEMRGLIREAREAGVKVILSHHDFQRTPSPERLRELSRKAREAGADVFKVATMTGGALDLAMLVEFLANEKANEKGAVAVMGMGAFGKVSRLVLAQAGSCLNYGYLGKPNASGQWPVELLKARIAELEEPV